LHHRGTEITEKKIGKGAASTINQHHNGRDDRTTERSPRRRQDPLKFIDAVSNYIESLVTSDPPHPQEAQPGEPA
jgi:hypothetical protein